MVASVADVTRFAQPGGNRSAVDHQIGALRVALSIERVKGNGHGHQVVAILQDRQVGRCEVMAECSGIDRGILVPRNHTASLDAVSALGVLVALQRGTVLNRCKG